MEELKYFTVALSLQKGFGPKLFLKLLEQYKNIENIFKLKLGEVDSNSYKYIQDSKNTITECRIKCKKYGLGIKCIWEDDYPFLLKQIHNPPVVLYYVGNWNNNLFIKSITIVGSRNPTHYGTKYTQNFIRGIKEYRVTVVSGLAVGIDKIAHEAALSYKLAIIAILAINPDEASPKMNSDLYKKILDDNGLIISEFSKLNNIKTTPGLFPARNRILAGISNVTLVTEAAEKSGSLITANLAFEYNREVLAVPGNLDNKYSVGTNSLIKASKATLVQNVDDILTSLGYSSAGMKSNESVAKIENLTIEERKVFDLLISSILNEDDLSQALALDIKKVNLICSMLQLRGLIKKNDINKFQIII